MTISILFTSLLLALCAAPEQNSANVKTVEQAPLSQPPLGKLSTAYFASVVSIL